MLEIRVDPLTGHRVVIATDRAGRPGVVSRAPEAGSLDVDADPFAEGHEDQTAPEVAAARPAGSAADTPGWRVRAVPNLYPVLAPDAPEPAPEANPDLYWSRPARGVHEVIVNAPTPARSLADLDVEQVTAAVEMWRERMRAHDDAACLHLGVNEGRAASATQPHTHAQLWALDFVPAEIARERERFGAYASRTMGANLLADLVQQEVRHRDRVVAIDSEAVLLSAYAARSPYQMTLAPRTARPRFQDDGPSGAALLHDALNRLRGVLGAMPALNLWVRTAPRGAEHFCWRIDIVPRLAPAGAIELGTGLAVNDVSPEDAASALRGAVAG